MTDEEAKTPDPTPSPEPTEPGPKPPRRSARTLTDPERQRILELAERRLGTREIARQTGLGRKLVRALLETAGKLGPPTPAAEASKLDPFREAIAERVAKNLTATRILRELLPLGFTGGLTILKEHVRSIRAPRAPRKRVHCRFETPAGEEIQIDWSPYRVPIGGKDTLVHAFGATLAWCRKLHVRFYPDERQPALLEAHVHAFEDFQGVTQRVVLDNMATVVLSRTGGPDGKPLWHPRYLDFSRYYGFDPFLCKVADPDRKGKDERMFWFLERDFVRGSGWPSLDAMNQAVRKWLDEIANTRVHGTTGRVPDEVWLEEKPFLIALPDARYRACEEEHRKVGPDSVLSIRGTPYTVPAALAHQVVTVRLYSDRFEVLDRDGRVALERRYVPPAERGRLVLDPEHYKDVPQRARRGRAPERGGGRRLEGAFLLRFPALAALVAGIKLRMKSLAHVHLTALLALADRYGDAAFLAAATRAQEHRRFGVHSVRRLLERDAPPPPEEPIPPVGADARAVALLGDVDPGSLDDYADLDRDVEEDRPW